MSPRTYALDRRQAASNRTRARILEAARELLADASGIGGFTVDAVAARADVSRMTVYYQFGSKTGLLEALFDELAAAGELAERAMAALQLPHPTEALSAYVAAFARFWSSERLVIRRLRSLGALDPQVGQGIQARDARRRAGLRLLVGRLADQDGYPEEHSLDEAVATLHMLTSFEAFDALAGPDRSPEEVVPAIQRLIAAALRRSDDPSAGVGRP
jgi:AcrR family transcriptional regulator